MTQKKIKKNRFRKKWPQKNNFHQNKEIAQLKEKLLYIETKKMSLIKKIQNYQMKMKNLKIITLFFPRRMRK